MANNEWRYSRDVNINSTLMEYDYLWLQCDGIDTASRIWYIKCISYAHILPSPMYTLVYNQTWFVSALGDQKDKYLYSTDFYLIQKNLL